jgi:hypothetical protein
MAIDLKTIPWKVSSHLADENFEQMGIKGNPVITGFGGDGLTAFGELLVAQLHPVFQYSFEYTVDNTDLTENATVNSGTVTQVTGMAVVAANTVTGSSARLESFAQAKYRAGTGGLARFTAKFALGGIAGTEQYIGLLDGPGSSAAFKNGYCIGFDGATFGVHRFQNDVKFTINLSDCDDPLDGSGPSGMIYDPTKLNVFAIRFQYLGAGAIEFEIEDDSTGQFVTFHKILYSNLNTVPSCYNPNFHIMMHVANLATTSNVILSCASMAYFVEGVTEEVQIHHPQNSTDMQQQTGVTTERAILTIRNKAIYAGKDNFVDVRLENLVSSIEAGAANNLGRVRLVKNATLGGTPSYADINTTDSVIDFDVAGTTVTGGKHILTFPLAGKNDKFVENILPYSIRLKHGQTLTVAGQSVNSATIEASLLWEELF